MAYMTPISFEQFLTLECVKDMPHFNQCAAHAEIQELMHDGITAFEKYGCLQPKELYDDVLAVCKELNFQISEYDKQWNVYGGGSVITVFLAFTEAITPSWALSEHYTPITQ